VLYSSRGLDMVSISMSCFSPSLGIILLKCFHGFPFGSLRKNLASNIFPSFLIIVSLC
jgi:hypothetical protein